MDEELRNAYNRSRMEIDTSGDREEIERLKEQGKYVVVYGSDICCPSTDAFIAYVETIVSVHDNWDDAFESLNKEDGNPNYGIVGGPKLFSDIQEPDPDYDDIPF